MTEVTVLHFAGVRDVTRTDEERIAVDAEPCTVGDVVRALVVRHPGLADYVGALRVAKNEAFASTDAEVATGDVVALIPPVAGG
ncbi:MAG: MoaD/ThiS family protein [Polyangiaceae bacterium]